MSHEQPEPPRPKINFDYLRLLETLPDNVFLRSDDDEPDPPQTMEVAA